MLLCVVITLFFSILYIFFSWFIPGFGSFPKCNVNLFFFFPHCITSQRDQGEIDNSWKRPISPCPKPMRSRISWNVAFGVLTLITLKSKKRMDDCANRNGRMIDLHLCEITYIYTHQAISVVHLSSSWNLNSLTFSVLSRW